MKFSSFITKHKFFLAAVGIVLLAVVLRFYQLGNVPHGMSWDEAAVGYNGFAIWTVHRDEWLQLMPFSFRSFGDYKAPLAIYANGLFTQILGLNLPAIRVPFALSGVVGVAAIMWLTYETLSFFGQSTSLIKKSQSLWLLGAGLLLAITPWHIHFTRIGMESGMALTFLMIGVAAWWRAMRLVAKPLFTLKSQVLNTVVNQAWLWQIFSIICLASSLYAYHSAKIMVPLLALVLLWLSRRQLWAQKKLLLVGLVTLCLVMVPLIWDSYRGEGTERLTQTTLGVEGKSVVQLTGEITTNFGRHFFPAFLVGGETTTLRHGDGHWGVLLWPTFILVVIGVISSCLPKKKGEELTTKMAMMAVLWILIGTFPAAIGYDVPHANRALLALPGWIWLAVIGFEWLARWTAQTQFDRLFRGTHGEIQLLVKSVIGLVILSHALFLTAYLHDYYTSFAAESANDFQDGYLEAIKYVLPYEKGDATHPAVDKIIIDNAYGQPYIFVLIARHTNPIWYHGGSLIKYEFPDNMDEGSLVRPKAIIVATGDRLMPWQKAEHLVYGTDGKIRFGIFRTE